MHLRRRLRLIFLALAIVVAVDLAADRFVASERDAYRRDVAERWEPARDLTSTLLFSLVDQETAQRSYIITGAPELLDAFATDGATADRTLADLERVLGDDPVIGPQLRRTRGRISAWRQLGASFEIEAKRAGRDAAARQLVSSGTSEELFDEARTEIDDLRRSIRARLAANERSLRRLERQSGALQAATAFAAFAAVLLSGRLTKRWLSDPIVEVARAVRTVAGGELDHPIPSPGPPEVAQLGLDVDAMRRRILEEVDDAARARESLAQRGMIVLKLRDELAPPPMQPPSGLQVATRFQPSESLVAGDWYELRRLGPDTLAFVVADVSGHGPTAGVFALKTKLLVQVAIGQGLGPAAAWEWVARNLGDTDEQFLTGIIGRIDANARTLTYANAGHPPMLLIGGEETTQLPPTGPIIGAFEGIWTERTETFPPGCAVVAYSDGLLEAQSSDGVWADLTELDTALRGARAGGAERLAEACIDFRGRHGARRDRDDVTIVAVASVTRPLSG